MQERIIGLVSLMKFITIAIEGVDNPADELFLLWAPGFATKGSWHRY